MKRLIIILFLLSATVLADTESDKSKFISKLNQSYMGALCGPEFLLCLNKSKKECVDFVNSVSSNCSVDNFFNTTKTKIEDKDLQQKEIMKESFLYSKCVTGEFFKKMRITEAKVDACMGSK